MNSNQLIDNEEALRLFFNDDIYLVGGMEKLETASFSSAENISPNSIEPSKIVESQPLVENANLVQQLPEVQQAFDFKYLGKNEKAILILVNDSRNPVSTPQGTELLRKLVLSINLKNADFALVNYSAYKTAKYEDFKTFFKCELLLSFGVAAADLALATAPLHQLTNIDETRMIFTHNLHDLDGDKPAKQMLWKTLQNLL